MASVFDTNWQSAISNPANKTFEIVEIGWEQHVLIDHTSGLVYRYPRNASASAKLDDEVALLESLNHVQWPVAIPMMRDHTEKYTVYDYIDGIVLEPEILKTLNDEQLTNIGLGLGKFLAVLHIQHPDLVNQKKTKHTTTLYEYYRDRIIGSKPSKEFNQAWNDFAQINEPNEANQVVVHGDLHGLNMVVGRFTKKLVGVIDFSELEIGDPHQDFRKIFMTHPSLLVPAVESYQNAGGPKLSEDKIKLWAYVNEWANICHFRKNPENLTYQRAYNHLKQWGRIK